MRAVPLAISSVFLVLSTWAQQGPSVVPAPEEMAPLQQLVGEWEGSGFAMSPEGRAEYRQTEDVRSAISGHAIVVEGHGTDATSGETVHDALAVIRWDENNERYRVDAWKADGTYVEATGRLDGEHFIWGFSIPQGQVRFTIDLSDPERWREIGEFSRDGERWMKYLEMDLVRR